MSTARHLTISSSQGPYDVDFVDSLRDAIDDIAALHDPFIVIDATVAERYAAELEALSAAPVITLAATEHNKTLLGVEGVCTFLASRGASKGSTLVAIGGGIVQDVATFCSHIYFRGIPFVYVPTTLLSMADSCIGAKCALNFGTAKNQLGFFHAPKRVIIATAFLTSLSDSDIRSGLGEIVKLALIESADDYATVDRALAQPNVRAVDLPALIFRSLEIKQRFIEQDEYDTGPRRLLNYGHTFGHALESLTDHAVPHGIAVAWGCDLVNSLSVAKGYLSQTNFAAIHRTLSRLTAGWTVPFRCEAAALVTHVRRDKKARAGVVDLVLLHEPGSIAFDRTPLDNELVELVDTYITTTNLFQDSARVLV